VELRREIGFHLVGQLAASTHRIERVLVQQAHERARVFPGCEVGFDNLDRHLK